MFEECRKMSLTEIQSTQLEAMKHIHEVCVKHDIKYYIIAGTMLGAVRHNGFIPWDDDIDIAMFREDFEKFKLIFNKEFDKSKYFLQHFETDSYFSKALMRVLVVGTKLDLPYEDHLKHRKEMYLDIFPLDNAPDTKEARNTHAKKIRNIDKLFKLRYYKIFGKDSQFSIFIKKCVSFFISLIPRKVLVKKRIEIMQQYNKVQTSLVVSTVSQYKYEKQSMMRGLYGNPTLIKFEDAEFFGPEYPEQYLKQLYGDNYMQIPPIEKRRTPTPVYKIK